MKILVITPDYPTPQRSAYPFVEQLVEEWARQGHDCTVLSPYSIVKNRRLYPTRISRTIGKGRVVVIRPNILSFSNFKIGKFSPSDWFHAIGIRYGLRKLVSKPDVIYGHFWMSGYDVAEYAIKNDIPLYVATGESNISQNMGDTDPSFSKNVKGVVCVSTKNMQESVSLGLASPDKCRVFPNAVNAELFHVIDKIECRARLGFPRDAFIVAYVGNYSDRKGPKRLVEALSGIESDDVKCFFVGFGDYRPQVKGMLFEGRLNHDDIPLYLNAADVFVLPTLNEGCCNAIVEAMSCGLPVISSNLPFNLDVLDDSNSIMVDPMDIKGIRDAIVALRDDAELRMSLSAGALEKAKTLTIDRRAQGIIDFMNTSK